MRRSTDFATVIRAGERVRRGALVVHHLAELTPGSAPVVGFVVGKPVGGSVTRHQVTRRLRAQVAQRLASLPGGSGTVVRALAGAADSSSAQLGTDLDAALRRVVVAS
jgi:ribonuclease P protein component